MSTKQEMASLKRDTSGNLLVDSSGCITCISEGGLQFQMLYKEIDFDCDSICCIFDNKEYVVLLHDNAEQNVDVKENESQELSCENMNDTASIHKEVSFSWTDASTKLFLCLYKEKKDLVTQRKIKTKKILWQKISEDMKIEGYNVSWIQVENKFKSLERSFKNIKMHNKKTGRNKISCPYEIELTELLGEKHNIEPLLLSGNKGIISKNDGKATTSSYSNANSDKENNHNSLNINISSKTHVRDDATLQQSALDTSIVDDIASSDTTDTYTTTKSKRQMGTTARIMHQCQESLQNLTNDIHRDNDNRCEFLKKVLDEYKEMRKSWEDSALKTQEQLIIANTLREERNTLLREFLQTRKG